MSDRELDAACARRLGLNVVVDYATVYGERVAINWWIGEKDDNTATPVFNYSSDPSAARWLEDEIERRGLQARYIEALGEVVPHYCGEYHGATVYPNMAVWAFLGATPEQRARAFLAATE